jgi:hypothetical protein
MELKPSIRIDISNMIGVEALLQANFVHFVKSSLKTIWF